MLTDGLRRTLTTMGTLTSHPAAFLIVGGYAALWFVFQRDTLDWHGVATIATWMMTLFIQRAEHRDTQAIHAKLDELVRATSKADDNLTKMDKEEPEDIEEHRDAKPA
jgi:low affinity Fe/Cu permease